MLARLARWLGEWAVVAVTSWLAWEQVANRLPEWSLYAILGGVVFLALITLPLGVNDDGSTRRLISKVSGRNNPSVVSGDQSPVSGNVIVAGKQNSIFVVTPAEARQISNDTALNELTRDTKAITMPDARAAATEMLQQRFGELTDALIEQINERDAKLFSRFADPRFLGPLGIAHRSYAEVGSDELRVTLSGLLTDLAQQPAGSRREIFLRQAIDVTRVLTIEHINSLAVKLLMATTFAEPYDTDMLIKSLDALLSPYYARIAMSRWDYLYMSSTGVCQDGQLGAFASGPYEYLHEKYRNSMYPALTFAEVANDPLFTENQELFLCYTESEDDVRVTEVGTYVSTQGARLRVSQDRASAILSTRNGAEKSLTDPEKRLRAIVLERIISVDHFKKRIAELTPDLAFLLDTLQRTGALHFPMQPVGYVLAQHESQSRTPQIAALVDQIFDADP